MKFLPFKKSLFVKFILSFSVTIILPIIILGSISYYRSASQIEEQVEELLQQIVKATNSQVDKVITDYSWLINRILTSQEVYDFLDMEPDDYYGKLQFSNWMRTTAVQDFLLDKPYIDGIVILTDKGMNYYDSKSDSQEKYGSGQLKRFDILKDKLPEDGSIKVFTSDLKTGSIENTLPGSFLITMGRRILSINSFINKGSFFLNMRAVELSEIWKNVDMKGGFIWIVNDEGKIIHHPDYSKLGMNMESVIDKRLLDGGKGRFIDNWSDKEYYFLSNISEYTGWRIIAAVPLNQLMKPVGNLKIVIIFTSLFAFPCSLALGYFFIRSIIKPIKKLRYKMIDTGKGIWNRFDGKLPGDEIGDLIFGFNTMVDRISNLIEQVYKSELEQQKEQLARKNAELQALQTQINPHFLYNTLGVINAYSEMNDTESIQEMIDALSSMFRYAVQNPMELVMIKDELKHVENFLLIQKHRSRNMPQIEWNTGGYEEFHILRLTLQPLIENVFKHGFAEGIKTHHEIHIKLREDGSTLVIDVTDNGAGPSCDIPEMEFIPNERGGKGGIGLSNVHRRLQLAFGEEYGLRISGIKGAGMTVKMVIPILEVIGDR